MKKVRGKHRGIKRCHTLKRGVRVNVLTSKGNGPRTVGRREGKIERFRSYDSDC